MAAAQHTRVNGGVGHVSRGLTPSRGNEISRLGAAVLTGVIVGLLGFLVVQQLTSADGDVPIRPYEIDVNVDPDAVGG